MYVSTYSTYNMHAGVFQLATKPGPGGAPVRVLCLHGFRQTAEGFYGRTHAFRRALRHVAVFDFLEGEVELAHPAEREGSGEGRDERGDTAEAGNAHGTGGESCAAVSGQGASRRTGARPRKCWWREDKLADGTVSTRGWREAVDTVLRHLCTAGPYQGICGFSQGGALAALVCEHIQSLGNTDAVAAFNVRFVMLFGAYNLSLVDVIPRAEIRVPSLHVWGAQDCTVDAASSQALASTFINAQVHKHPGGHYIPTSPADRDIYRSFIANVCQDRENVTSG
jgi:dihydrofolate reductase